MPDSPKHRRGVITSYKHDYPSSAECTCGTGTSVCPRHDAEAYTDAYAVHATDSVGKCVGAPCTDPWVPGVRR